MNVEFVLEPDSPYRKSLSEIVGANVRSARAVHGWSRDTLGMELRGRGLAMSVRTLRRLEGGERQVSVDELVVLGLALQVPPLTLISSPAGTVIVAPDGSPITHEEIEGDMLGVFVNRPPQDPELDADLELVGTDTVVAWLHGWSRSERRLLFDAPEPVRAWAWRTWLEGKRTVIFAQQDLFDALNEVEARRPELRAKQQLLSEYWPSLPDTIKRALEHALQTNDFSDVPVGWDVLALSNEQIEKQLGRSRQVDEEGA